MNDINKPSNSENLGGLQIFWFAPVSDILVIGNKINGLIQSVTFNTGKNWLKCYCTAETMKYSEPKKVDEKGEYFEAKLSGWIPKDTPELLEQFNEMDQFKYVCIYKDNNGYYKLIGNLDEPLNFTTDLEIPEGVSASN